MTITTNINEIMNDISDLDRRQIPYATSLALNKTAEEAMQKMVIRIGEKFKVTASWNKVGGKYGIKKIRAKKNDLAVTIYIPDANTWIEDHQDAGIRTGTILIPTEAFKNRFNLRTNRSIKKKAKTLLSNKSKNRIFKAHINGDEYVMQRVKGKVDGVRRLRSSRTGRLLRAKKVLRRDAIPLFIIKSRVEETRKLEFFRTITASFSSDFNRQFDSAFEYAMSTAR